MNPLRINGAAERDAPGLLSLAVDKEPPRWSAILCAGLVLWFSVPTLASLHEIWFGGNIYGHGYLVLAMTAWLVARELRRAPLVHPSVTVSE